MGRDTAPAPSEWLPASLHPAVPPRFVNKVRASPFVEGEDAQLTCTIEGAPHPQIRWASTRAPGAGLQAPVCSARVVQLDGAGHSHADH